MNANTDTHRVVLMRCEANQCNQGRNECPCPEACQIAEEEAEFERRQMQALATWLAVLLVVAGFLAGYVWGVLP